MEIQQVHQQSIFYLGLGSCASRNLIMYVERGGARERVKVCVMGGVGVDENRNVKKLSYAAP